MNSEPLDEHFYFDVEKYFEIIDHDVEVKSIDDKLYSGRLYTVDPLTSSVVLIDSKKNQVQIISSTDIAEMKVFSRSEDLSNPFAEKIPSEEIDSSCSDRLEKIRLFLRSKRIPFEEKRDKNDMIDLFIQNGIVQIKSPYDLSSIVGTNEIVLGRMKTLLKPVFT